MIPALIVPILTGPDLLHRMLDSIDHPVGDLVIIDNGDCFPAWEPVEHVERTHVIKMPANLGVAGSWNLGIKATPFAPWWLIVNHDVTFPPGALVRLAVDARTDAICTVADTVASWCCFTIGEDVVSGVGLFSEAYHPGYFEDVEYAERTQQAGFRIINTGVRVHHDNSATLKSGYDLKNRHTYAANEALCRQTAGDRRELPWSLARRRDLSWD